MVASGFHSRILDRGPSSRRPRPRGPAPKKNSSPRSSGKTMRLWMFLKRVFDWFCGPPGSRSIKRFILRSAGTFVTLIILYLGFLWVTLPDISDPKSLLVSESTVIADRNGIELYRLFNERDATFIALEDIPLHMQQAIVSIEDERFYDRGCLDLRALARAVFLLGRAGGGSTITRQLARNALNLLNDNRYQRKIKELILGCQLERKYTKDELMELYLNWIPFGRNAYGIEQASQYYFATSARDLTLAQSAVLAALPQRPSYFSPYGNHIHTEVSEKVHQQVADGKITKSSQIPGENVRIGLLGSYVGTGSITLYVGGRTDQVLKNMQDQGFIEEQDRLAALEELESITFQRNRETIRAPHFVLWVREQIEEMFEGTAEDGLLEQGGLQVETTLDWRLQEAAEEVVAFHKDDLFERYGAWNLGLVAVDPVTREILTYVGNTDYNDEEHGGKIDMARAPRQPGSSFKPFVYASAFLNGYSPATPIYDVPTKIGEDEPQNFDGEFFGLLTMRQALGASRNIPAAKSFFLGGGENTILRLASTMGAQNPLEMKQKLTIERGEEYGYGWPLALGAAETPLLEMVHAYSTFADEGLYKPLISIRRITDKSGNLLYENVPDEQESEEVLDPRVAYQITSVLSDESARPEEYWKTQLTVPGYQTAAKTGTSNKCLEWTQEGFCKLRKPDNAWLIGYTPALVAGAWAGNADSTSMYDKAGGLNTASPLWRDYMMRAHRLLEEPKTEFAQPEGVVSLQVSTLSGQLPTACTPVEFRQPDVFLEETPPTLQDPACAQLMVDRVTNLLASETCPAEAKASGSFLVVQSILPQRWPLWEQGVQEWADGQMELWLSAPDHSGAIIPLPKAPTEYCDPSLTPGRLEKPALSIDFPPNGGMASYPSFRPRITYTVGSTIQEVTYHIDGKQVAKATSAPHEPTIRAPRSVKQEGTHTLRVTLIDQYFNEVTKTVRFQFGKDSGGPQVILEKPRDGVIVPSGSEVTMRARATDDEGGVKYVQFFLDDTLLTTKPKAPYELTYSLDKEPGEYQLRAVATDLADNVSEDSVTVIVEF